MNRIPFYDDWVTTTREEYEQLRQERDELLTACRAMSEVASVDCADKIDWAAFWKAANQIDAVIARVEQ